MKGIVFTEFLDMVDSVYSPEVVEDIIEASELASAGPYTAVGTYPSLPWDGDPRECPA